MNQDVTADDRVEPAARPPAMNVGLDAFDVLHPFSRRAGLEGCQRRRINVNRRHAAMAPDQSGGEQRDVTDAAPDIEYLHTRRNSSAMEELFCQRIQY